jgi:predicted esterase
MKELPQNLSAFQHHFIPAESRLAPVLLLLHGTGGNEDDLLGLGSALLPGAALLSPRGQVLENGMPRFFRRIAEGIFDENDLIARTGALADFIVAAAQHYQFDANKVVAAGYSNGANIAASLLLLRPEVLSGAVLFRAMVPLQPLALPDLTEVPVFIASGKHDPVVPVENAERLAQMFRTAGAEVTHHWTNTGHALAEEDVQQARQWIVNRQF